MRAARLTILVGADDYRDHKPLYHQIVTRARAEGLAGATVLQGCEGFGRSRFVHTDRSVDLADNLPTAVVIVDTDDRVRAFLAHLDDLLTGATVTLDEVEIHPT